jgi:transglutaminase-like putative cysteine protease
VRFSPSSGRSPSIRSRRLRFRRYRPSPLDRLESRQLLAIQPVTEIVVGRTLTAYSEGAVTNGELRITYSVYNQTESELTNVQLSSTLASGVTFLDATAEPVRAGQALTWNLGGLSAFGRASIEVRVGLDPASSQAIDTGSAVSALLNGLGVTDTAPAARLRSGQIAPELLAATPDADSDDPFIQEQAARLDYDASHIFEFLRDGIGYDSYVGSLRGSRGALWSAAGNTLDEASLGVALYRASGIPAQYARGSLPDPLAHELILSMFPEPLRILGFVPDNAEKGDPANDPRLLAEARDHYWIQFDTGVGMTDADTTFAGSMIGQSFAAGVTTFTEVADNLRHKVRVQLDRELANTASALFGVGVLGVSTVLEATFNAAALVGRPLSIGHFVNRQGLGSPIFSSITNTYTPFIAEYDLAADNTNAHVISGATFEELLTNFPFGSQILTGLFLTVELSGPDGPPERYERTLVDLIGFDIRTNGGTPSLDFDPMALPTLTPFDVFTLNVQSSKIDDAAVGRYAVLVSELQELVADRVGDDPVALVSESATLAQQLLMATTHVSAAEFFLFSDLFADQLAQAGVVRAYPDRPRLVITSNQTASSGIAATQVGFQSAIDLRRDALRVNVRRGDACRGRTRRGAGPQHDPRLPRGAGARNRAPRDRRGESARARRRTLLGRSQGPHHGNGQSGQARTRPRTIGRDRWRLSYRVVRDRSCDGRDHRRHRGWRPPGDRRICRGIRLRGGRLRCRVRNVVLYQRSVELFS